MAAGFWNFHLLSPVIGHMARLLIANIRSNSSFPELIIALWSNSAIGFGAIKENMAGSGLFEPPDSPSENLCGETKISKK